MDASLTEMCTNKLIIIIIIIIIVKLLLTSNGEDLGEVDVKRGKFQGDSLSPLLTVLSMVTLSLILRKINASYE